MGARGEVIFEPQKHLRAMTYQPKVEEMASLLKNDVSVIIEYYNINML